MVNQNNTNSSKVDQKIKVTQTGNKVVSEAELKKQKELQAMLEERKEIEMYNQNAHENRKMDLFGGNCISKLFMFNLSKVVDAGMKQPYKFFMLYFLPKEFTYEGDYKNFEKFYQEKSKKIEAAGKKMDFLDLVFEYLGSRYQWGAFLNGLRMLSDILFPIFLK